MRAGKGVAKDVLERMMRVAEDVADIHKPPTEQELQAALAKSRAVPSGDWTALGNGSTAWSTAPSCRDQNRSLACHD